MPEVAFALRASPQADESFVPAATLGGGEVRVA